MNRRTLLLGLAASALTAACSSLGPQTGSFAEKIEGRFSTVTEFRGRKESQTGSFTLRRSGSATVLELGHPLTGILARITVSPQLTTLETSDGKKLSDRTPERLMMNELGFSFPVTEMMGWLSSPPPGDELSAPPWRIEFLTKTADGLPKLVRVTRAESAAAPSVRLTVTIDKRDANAS